MEYSIAQTSVVVVDDTKFSRDIIAHMLRQGGVETIHEAENGQDGLALCDSVKPGLIIADLLMPGMDGYEFCRQIRARKEFIDTPIIVQTGVEEASLRMQAFAAGATDLVMKPVNPYELLARTRLHLERQKLLFDLRQYREQTSEEIAAAKEVQRTLLPTAEELAEIMQSMPLAVSSFFEPSTFLSGDMLGIRKLPGGELAFYLVDFAGHGIKAALNTFRLHTLMATQLPPQRAAGAYLTQLNAKLYPLLKANEFATMFYGVLDLSEGLLHYASAASASPLILSHGGPHPSVLDSTGIPLGVLANTEYVTHTIEFLPGDTFFGFSDALIEAQKNPTHILNEYALHELCYEYMVCANGSLPENPAQFQRWILDMYQTYSLSPRYEDDMTLLLISRRG